MDWPYLKKDIQYIFLNRFVCKIPSWHIRCLFYKFCGMKIHKTARIGINTVVVSPRGIEIGMRSVINDNCVIDGSGGVYIGNDVSISAYSKVYSCSHNTNSPIFEFVTNPVEIQDNVWIAANAMILDGTVFHE